MNVSIRQAFREDISGILDLYGELESDKSAVLSEDRACELFDKMMSYPNYKLYVAVEGNDIIGTFSLAVMDNLAHMGNPPGLIEDVVVKSNWRGKGIGKQMIRFALERCRECGCYKAVLSSNKIRKEAHRFYESLGFEIHGFSFLTELL